MAYEPLESRFLRHGLHQDRLGQYSAVCHRARADVM